MKFSTWNLFLMEKELIRKIAWLNSRRISRNSLILPHFSDGKRVFKTEVQAFPRTLCDASKRWRWSGRISARSLRRRSQLEGTDS